MPRRRDIDDFLAQKRIAFVGISRDPKQFSSRVYSAMRDRGYKLYPVNPNAKAIAGEPCYPSVDKLPEPVDAVMVMVQPDVVQQVMQGCVDTGVKRVWLGNGAVSQETVKYGEEHGVVVVDGACPMMFLEPVGFGHACHRFVKQITGTMPK